MSKVSQQKNKENAQLKMNQILGKKLVVSGHIGEVTMINFSDGNKAIEFNSKDGLINLVIVTQESFLALPEQAPATLKFVSSFMLKETKEEKI
jgi:ribosomal protein S4E